MRVGTWGFLTVFCLCSLLLTPEPGDAIFPLCLWRGTRSLDSLDVVREAEEMSLRPEATARQPRVPLFMRSKDLCDVVCRNSNGINNMFCEKCCPRRNTSMQQQSTTPLSENQLAMLLSMFLESRLSTTTAPQSGSTQASQGTSSSSIQTTVTTDLTTSQ